MLLRGGWIMSLEQSYKASLNQQLQNQMFGQSHQPQNLLSNNLGLFRGLFGGNI